MSLDLYVVSLRAARTDAPAMRVSARLARALLRHAQGAAGGGAGAAGAGGAGGGGGGGGGAAGAAARGALGAAAARAAGARPTGGCGRAGEGAWRAWHSLENAQLNWVRNGLSTSGLGIAMIQFRTAQNNEDDVTQNDLPPVGGFVLMCAGQLMLLSGAVQHVAGAYALRQRLRLTPVGCAAVLAHALLPMAAFGTAMACVVGCHPRWVCHAMWGAREALPPLLSEKRLNNLARMKLGIETGG